MSGDRLHDDEVPVDAPLVRRLLAAQFPSWADLPLEPFDSAGTDNRIYRLGADLSVRLPRTHRSTRRMDKEHRWVPKLASHLPLAVPVPLARGEAAEGYPWPWSVYPWLHGEDAATAHLADPGRAAATLAGFITALQQVDPEGGPEPGLHNFFRGVPLATRNTQVRDALAALQGTIDVGAATAAWEAALDAPAWQGPPVWIHGDLMPGNLLLEGGRLRAVIDFGGLGVGDPACDMIVAWNLLPADARDAFRAELAVDDATWARGRGWALSIGLIALPYYRRTHPVMASTARHTIDAVLADPGGTLGTQGLR